MQNKKMVLGKKGIFNLFFLKSRTAGIVSSFLRFFLFPVKSIKTGEVRVEHCNPIEKLREAWLYRGMTVH